MNTFEMLGRERKAVDIARALEMENITADCAATGTPEEWRDAAKLAGYDRKKPPSQETIDMVLQMMRSREGKADGQ